MPDLGRRFRKRQVLGFKPSNVRRIAAVARCGITTRCQQSGENCDNDEQQDQSAKGPPRAPATSLGRQGCEEEGPAPGSLSLPDEEDDGDIGDNPGDNVCSGGRSGTGWTVVTIGMATVSVIGKASSGMDGCCSRCCSSGCWSSAGRCCCCRTR